jgi:membrane associated rhomboid family serine protease
VAAAASIRQCSARPVSAGQATQVDAAQAAVCNNTPSAPGEPERKFVDSNLVIIAITCIVTFIAFGNRQLLEGLILWPPAVSRRHQYYRLVTYGLVHASPGHLLFNMITLFFFGRVMQQLYTGDLGARGYAGFYVGGLVVSILPTFLANRDNAAYRSLGASGAVSAVLFAFILVQPWTTIYVYVLPVPAIVYAVLYVVYSIYMDRRAADNVNHSAHLWGAAYGVAFTLMMEPRLFSLFLASLSHPQFRLH